MNALDSYKVDLKDLPAEGMEYRFKVDDAFFAAVQGTLVKAGEADVALEVEKKCGCYALTFHIKGRVRVPCDRCLEDMDIDIDTKRVLDVVPEGVYDDAEREALVLPKGETVVDVAWNIYEFIALEVPISHVHGDGECNPAMLECLSAHSVSSGDGGADSGRSGDEEEHPVDPRWNELKKILDNN